MEDISGSLQRYDEDHEKKGEDYTTQELEKYCENADEFFQIWVELHGGQGNTNYIHMIGSGHMYHYMSKWGNLTKYSQQGWEALNALIKLFFFRRTNKGGKHSGTLTQFKSIFFFNCKTITKALFQSAIWSLQICGTTTLSCHSRRAQNKCSAIRKKPTI